MLMLARCRGYERPIAMQNLYNLIQREEEQEMLPLCIDEGVGVIPYSPLARGILAGNRGPGGGETERAQHDKLAHRLECRPCDQEIIDRLVHLAKEHGRNPTQIALAWLLQRPSVVAPIMGATRVEYIDDAIAALAIELTEEEVRYLEEPYVFRPWRPA